MQFSMFLSTSKKVGIWQKSKSITFYTKNQRLSWCSNSLVYLFIFFCLLFSNFFLPFPALQLLFRAFKQFFFPFTLHHFFTAQRGILLFTLFCFVIFRFLCLWGKIRLTAEKRDKKILLEIENLCL